MVAVTRSLMRSCATDALISGKRLACGYGDVGRALQSRGQFARVAIPEVDPICALQACMMDDVTTLEDVVADYDVFVMATGIGIISAQHMADEAQRYRLQHRSL